MTSSSSRPDRQPASRTGLVLLLLALGGMVLGILALVVFWARRLARAR